MDRAQLGKSPIPGEAPTGRDPKYEPAYGVLQDEIRKLTSITGGVTWSVVVNSATEVLDSIAKDIPAAVYLAVGLGHTEGLVGWAQGTQVCADILAEYWDTAFPPLARLRARANSLEWWKECSLVLMDGWTSNPPCSWEDFTLAQEALAAMDAQIVERLPDQSPLYDMREALRRIPVQSPSLLEEHAPDAASQESTSQAPVASDIAPVTQKMAATAQVPTSRSAASFQSVKTLPDAYELLHQLAGEVLNFLCGAEPSPEPLAWQIVYASQIGKIGLLPPADGEATAIPAPDSAMLTVCRSHLEAGRYLAGVSAAVAFAPACPLWLDVQRCVAEGLAAAGPDYAAALSVVRHACACLLERLPGLAERTFADGTPFADPLTRSWLDSLSSGDGTSALSPEEELAGVATAKAGTLNGQGHTAAALDALEEAAKTVSINDGAACLRLQTQQVRMLCRESQVALAANIAEDMTATVEHHKLDQWNPALALEVWQAAYTAFAALSEASGGGEDGIRTREALKRITRLSPATAFRLKS